MLSPYKSLEFVLSDDESPDPWESEAKKSRKRIRSCDSASSATLNTSSSATNVTAAGNDSDCDMKPRKLVGVRQPAGKLSSKTIQIDA